MDTPESPTQSPQSPEEEEKKGASDSELLDSPAEASRPISDSELLNDEDGGGEFSELDEDGGSLERAEQDLEEAEGMAGFARPPRAGDMRGTCRGLMQSPEDEEGEERISPESPDFEPAAEGRQALVGEEEDEDEGIKPRGPVAAADADDDEEEVDAASRRRVAVSELKDESSVSRELDEHELDYDEEVPEERSVPPPEEDDAEKPPGGDEGDEEDDDGSKKEQAQVQAAGEKDAQPQKAEDPCAQERSRRDSLHEKKEEDDGEIDEGEIDDDDLEEGEVKDPMDRKIRPRPICRFFMKGNCTWGMNCRFIHPGVNDKGNYSLISKPDPFSPNGAPPGGPHPLMPSNPWGGPAVEELPPPPPPMDPPVESAWERGLRHAKEVLKKATIRKEQEPDFEEKRFNVTIGEDERDFDKENDFFRERGYRITREIREPGDLEFRDLAYVNDPYADPYYDYEMEALWRGGQYENFRVQYTETPLPYHYSERERDPRERRDRERDRERDQRERRQREREREREREKERQRRKEEWERDRLKRDDKDRSRERPPREPREKKDDKDKPKPITPEAFPLNPLEPPVKKDIVPMAKRPDEWKDPWRRSKSPRRRPGLMGSPPRGRRRHRPSGSSVSLSNSSRSSSRSSSYTGSGSSRSRSHSRSSSYSSYSHSSQHSSFSGSRSRSRSFSSSPSPAGPRNAAKAKPELIPPAAKGAPPKPATLPPPRRDKPPPKKVPSPPLPSQPGKPPKPPAEGAKPPNQREAARPPPPREPGKPPNMREGRKKESPQQNVPRRRTVSGSVSGSGSSYSGSSSRSSSASRSRSGSRKSRSLSVSSVSSVSSASSSSSSVQSADTDNMYADLASPVSSASSRSPTPGHSRKERGPPRDRGPNKERAGKPPKKDERKRLDPSGLPPKTSVSSIPRSGPSTRGGPVHTTHMGPPGAYGSHKDIKLTLLNKQADRGNRKRYFPSDKERPMSPSSKRIALSPDRARDRRIPGRPPLSPRMERPRGQAAPRSVPPQGERKRPLSPQPKTSAKAPAVPLVKPPGPVSGAAKPSNTLSRREELLKQLKAVEDAIARKRAKIPGK
ncbi:zinc finger CCCH domain-containing protein 18 isoform X2 [Denticeps clupeoides]|uniref:zinc finger CCCH domain-containing protein 18 isoform X2 n=1 Tax=Denticeps clupeoides TaxID=299321 RepID=UPI0010A2FEBB|nr:zinc finger CCCH domain-containing protein 18 isoform X2 [Denticeps clupeoides]